MIVRCVGGLVGETYAPAGAAAGQMLLGMWLLSLSFSIPKLSIVSQSVMKTLALEDNFDF